VLHLTKCNEFSVCEKVASFFPAFAIYREIENLLISESFIIEG